MAPPTGVEPATYRLGGRSANNYFVIDLKGNSESMRSKNHNIFSDNYSGNIGSAPGLLDTRMGAS